jgi:hypothetical protein
MHLRTRLVTDRRTLSEVQGRLPMVWQTQKCVGEVCLHFLLQLNSLGALSVPTHKNTSIKNWGPENVGAVPRKLRNWYEYFVLVFVWGTQTWNLSQYFRSNLYTQQQVLSIPVAHTGQTVRPEEIKWGDGRENWISTLTSVGLQEAVTGPCVSRHSQERRRKVEGALCING